MNSHTFFALIVMSTSAFADPCDSGKNSVDGVPAAYSMHECKGNRALAQQDAKSAAFHFRKALSVSFVEAPNYFLKVELAKALCLLGERNEAEKTINEFMCMTSVDLDNKKCYTKDGKRNPSISDTCFSICEFFGSTLNAKGRDEVESRRVIAQDILSTCDRPNPAFKRDSPRSGRAP